MPSPTISRTGHPVMLEVPAQGRTIPTDSHHFILAYGLGAYARRPDR